MKKILEQFEKKGISDNTLDTNIMLYSIACSLQDIAESVKQK